MFGAEVSARGATCQKPPAPNPSPTSQRALSINAVPFFFVCCTFLSSRPPLATSTRASCQKVDLCGPHSCVVPSTLRGAKAREGTARTRTDAYYFACVAHDGPRAQVPQYVSPDCKDVVSLHTTLHTGPLPASVNLPIFPKVHVTGLFNIQYSRSTPGK